MEGARCTCPQPLAVGLMLMTMAICCVGTSRSQACSKRSRLGRSQALVMCRLTADRESVSAPIAGHKQGVPPFPATLLAGVLCLLLLLLLVVVVPDGTVSLPCPPLP
jgi:hypothetical protein